jgi:hypothetical protein
LQNKKERRRGDIMEMIFRTSGQDSAPDWYAGGEEVPEFEGYLSPEEAERIVSLPSDLTEEDLVEERDFIETVASSEKTYYYNEKWPEEVIDHILEYAEAVGVKKVAGVNPLDEKIASFVGPGHVQKTASAVVTSVAPETARVAELEQAMGDPFGLADPKEHTEMEKSNWETVSPERKLEAPNVLMSSNSILSIPGGEDYRKSPNLKVKPGQNSVADPDAIGKLATQEDTGARLKRQNKDRAEQREMDQGAWQKEAVDQAKALGAGSLPRGSVFMTQAEEAQPGLRETSHGVSFGQTPSDIPELSEGEMLKQKNASRRESIQREASTKKGWEKLSGAARHEISDSFAEGLEQRLNDLS